MQLIYQQKMNKAEYVLALIILFAAGFLGSQKMIHSLQSEDSAVNIHKLSSASCAGGFRIPGIHCESHNEPGSLNVGTQQPAKQAIQFATEKKLVIPVKGYEDRPLREQFASLPELKPAILHLRWQDGDEQDAARLLSIVNTLSLARNDPYKNQFAAAAISSLFAPVWDKYPELVAASHCLYCGSFFEHALQGYIATGTQEKAWFRRFVSGHPRFLRVAYEAGQISDDELKNIARLHAELQYPGDGQTSRFIGNVLLHEKDYGLLRRWSTTGMNGESSFESVQDYATLPRALLIDAWQMSIAGGFDSTRLTRYLIKTGYRPALRWLIWLSAGNVDYLKTYHYKHYEKQRYASFLKEMLNIPPGSFSDLAGFYSENWQKINWDQAEKRWVLML